MTGVVHVGFAASYDADDVVVRASLDQPWHGQINIRARKHDRVVMISLEPIAIEIDGHQATVSRSVNFFPDVRVVDTMIDIRCETTSLDSWVEGEMHPGHLTTVKDSSRISIAALLDEMYGEVIGVPTGDCLSDPPRTTFGSVVFHRESLGKVEGHRRVFAGVRSDEELLASPNRMDVYGLDTDDPGHRMSYLLLASLCSRSRHLAWRIIDSVRQLTIRAGDGTHYDVTLADALDIRRDAVLASVEMTGFGYLGTGDLVRVYDEIFHVAAVSSSVERAFSVSSDGLHQLSQGMFTLAAERNGRTLSHVALAFTFVSIFLGVIAVGDFFLLPYGTRPWIVVLWMVSALSLLLVLVLMWRTRQRAVSEL